MSEEDKTVDKDYKKTRICINCDEEVEDFMFEDKYRTFRYACYDCYKKIYKHDEDKYERHKKKYKKNRDHKIGRV